MSSYHIASVKSIMSRLFRSWPGEGLCVYASGLSQRGMRDVQQGTAAFAYPQRAAYQSCFLSKYFLKHKCYHVIAECGERNVSCTLNLLHSLYAGILIVPFSVSLREAVYANSRACSCCLSHFNKQIFLKKDLLCFAWFSRRTKRLAWRFFLDAA